VAYRRRIRGLAAADAEKTSPQQRGRSGGKVPPRPRGSVFAYLCGIAGRRAVQFEINGLGFRNETDSHCGKRDESANGADLQHPAGGTRGLAPIPRGNGEKEAACRRVSIRLLQPAFAEVFRKGHPAHDRKLQLAE